MEETEDPDAARPVLSRTLQACQRCRSLKTRCLPSSQSGVCQRCFSAGKGCQWAEVPRRARKLRAPSRIAQVEQKIDGLVASLVNPPAPKSPVDATSEEVSIQAPSTGPAELRQDVWLKQRTVAPGSWMQLPSSFEPRETQPDQDIEGAVNQAEADRQYLEKIRNIHDFGDREDMGQAPGRMFQPTQRRESPIENDLVKQILSTGEADKMLNEYRQMSASFPFVVLPPGISGHELHSEKPMLFLAIMTATSWRDNRRQMSLDKIYRDELANRTIIRPRKTVGLVQSLLVYLSWYHFIFSHKTQQIFFLHHLVIGLALDVGLHQDYQPMNFSHRPKPPPLPPKEQRERRRAFLGCYYLVSMIAAGLQKPNLLKHSPHMNEWAQGLGRDREYESDEVISHLVSLRQIDDQVQDTLFTGSAAETPLSDPRTLMHVRFMQAQLDTWKRDSFGSTSQRLLDLSSSYTTMLLHSIALRPLPPSDQPSVTTDTTNLQALISALEAGKQFLDALLSFPGDEYHLISFSEWMRLPTVIMTVARLCMPSTAHAAAGWDIKTAQERVRLDLYLESICYRMHGLSSYDPRKQPRIDFWYAMRMICELTKSWYMRKIRPDAAPSSGNLPTPSEMEGQTGGRGGGDDGTGAAPCPHITNPLAGIHDINSINMELDLDTGPEVHGDPFAFVKDMEFDMEQFFDMGIWDDGGYVGMGFGGGRMPF